MSKKATFQLWSLLFCVLFLAWRMSVAFDCLSRHDSELSALRRAIEQYSIPVEKLP